jgi:hypothetical protein
VVEVLLAHDSLCGAVSDQFEPTQLLSVKQSMSASSARAFLECKRAIIVRVVLRNALHSRAKAQASLKDIPPLLVDEITSVNNSYVKHCVKLRTNSSYRRKTGRMILAGQSVIAEQLGTNSNATQACACHVSEIDKGLQIIVMKMFLSPYID